MTLRGMVLFKYNSMLSRLSIYRFKMIGLIILCSQILACSQSLPADLPKTDNPAFDQKINSLLRFDVPVISVEDLAEKRDQVVLLDARELEEYQTSHIAGALHIGYNKVNMDLLKKISKEKELVVYCSIGYRSEKVGKILQEQGFENVSNLYGSLFAWANKGYPLVDSKGKATQTVHGYNKAWSKWLDESRVIKTW